MLKTKSKKKKSFQSLENILISIQADINVFCIFYLLGRFDFDTRQQPGLMNMTGNKISIRNKQELTNCMIKKIK
jgi:hypothetical protein